MQTQSDQTQTTVTERDRRLVNQHLGAFLLLSLKAGPNSAVADNARRAAEEMVAAERERCVAWIKHWFGGDNIDDRGYECVREIKNDL